jgi:hypothetical protein
MPSLIAPQSTETSLPLFQKSTAIDSVLALNLPRDSIPALLEHIQPELFRRDFRYSPLASS